MGKKSIKRNYIYNLSYQLLALLAPLVTTPYISRVLGADGVGISSYTNAVTTYFLIAAVIGTTDYGQREIAYRQDQEAERTKMFWEIAALRAITGTISLLFFIAITFSSKYRVIYILQAFNILSVIFDISWFFQGLEEFGKTTARSVAAKLINIAVIFMFVKTKSDLPIYIASISLSTFVSNVCLWFSLPEHLGKVSFKEIRPFSNFGVIMQFFIPTIAMQVTTVLDKTMLGFFNVSGFENGYYEQADRIEKLCLTVVSSLGIVMIPRIAHIIVNNDNEKLRYYIYRAYRFIWMLSIPMMFGLIGIANVFVPWFFGAGYEKTITLIKLFSVLLCIVGLSNVTGMQYFIPAGRQVDFTKSVVIGLIINFIMNALLIPRYMSIGAVVATIISELAVTGTQLLMVRNVFSVKKILLLGKNYLLAAVVMGAALFLENTCAVNLMGFVGCFVRIGIGAVVYGAVLVLLRDEMVVEAIGMVRQRVFNNK